MPITKDLQKLGFTEPSTDIKNIVMDVFGVRGQGKTHFACTAPGPIAYFNFDYGAKGVIGKFQAEGKEIFEKIIDIPDVDKDTSTERGLEQISDSAKPIWTDFANAWKAIMVNNKIRTVVLDTATEAYELLRIYKFGKLTEVMPHMYGPVKAVFRRTLKMASSGKVQKNLIMINKMKDEYIGRNATGKKIEAGFDDSPYIADLSIQLKKKLPTKRDPSTYFIANIEKCRVNTLIEGEAYQTEIDGNGNVDKDGECKFSWIATMAVPGTVPEEWE